MTLISIAPPHAHDTAATLNASSRTLDGINSHLQRQWSALDAHWHGSSKGRVEGEVYVALGQLSRLIGNTRDLGVALEAIANRFESADENIAFSVMGMAWSTDSLTGTGSGIDTGVFIGTDELILGGGLSGFFLPISDLSERIRNWLAGRGWITEVEPIASPFGDLINQPRPPTTEPARTTFGDLLKTSEKTASGSSAESVPAPVSPPLTEAVAMPQTRDQWWLDVPASSQQDLHLPSGTHTAYGCTPTAVSMILDYWHAKDPVNNTMSAQELLKANADQGVFHNGMSPTQIHDEVRGLGYSVVEDQVYSNFDSLKAAVAEGPVVAIVKLGLKADGENHAVVVTGVSPNNELRINDPWDGQSRTYTWEAFSRSWGADFGKGAPTNSFVVIRPT
jgi:uncharacterized protein YukE